MGFFTILLIRKLEKTLNVHDINIFPHGVIQF